MSELECLMQKLRALHGPMHEANAAVDRLTAALGLPYRPIPLQSMAELKKLSNEICGMVSNVLAQNIELRRRLGEEP